MLFKLEIKNGLKSMMLWAVSMSALFVIYIFFYTMLQADIQSYLQMIPSSMVALLGGADLGTFLGFMSFVLRILILALGTYGLWLGINVNVRETRLGTNDFLFTKPISWSAIYIQKVCGGLLLITLSSLTQGFISWLTIAGLGIEISAADLFLLFLGLTLTTVLLFAAGVLIGIVVVKIRSAISAALISMSICFAWDIAINLAAEPGFAYFSPLKWFDFAGMLTNQGIDPLQVSIGIVVFVLCLGGGFQLFTHRQLEV